MLVSLIEQKGAALFPLFSYLESTTLVEKLENRGLKQEGKKEKLHRKRQG